MTRRFVYLVEGEPYIGTLQKYADAVREAHYSGLEVDRSVWIFEDGNPVSTVARFSSTPYDEDDYSTLLIELEFEKDDPEVAWRRIDGRV